MKFFTKSKRQNKPLKPIADGIEKVQLYICPSCGRKQKKSWIDKKCVVCSIGLCWECRKGIELGGFLDDTMSLCSEHHKELCKCIKDLLSKMGREANAKSIKVAD